MNAKSIGKGILLAFVMLAALVAVVSLMYIGLYIYAIVLGSIFEVVNTGNLPVTTGTESFLNDTELSYFAVAGNVTSGAEFAGSLIPIAVVILVFAAFIVLGYFGYSKLKKGKSGKGGMSF